MFPAKKYWGQYLGHFCGQLNGGWLPKKRDLGCSVDVTYAHNNRKHVSQELTSMHHFALPAAIVRRYRTEKLRYGAIPLL